MRGLVINGFTVVEALGSGQGGILYLARDAAGRKAVIASRATAKTTAPFASSPRKPRRSSPLPPRSRPPRRPKAPHGDGGTAHAHAPLRSLEVVSANTESPNSSRPRAVADARACVQGSVRDLPRAHVRWQLRGTGWSTITREHWFVCAPNNRTFLENCRTYTGQQTGRCWSYVTSFGFQTGCYCDTCLDYNTSTRQCVNACLFGSCFPAASTGSFICQ
jgi:hypothetical protein